MRNITTILLLLISSIAFGQGTINFGASRATDTGLTKGQLKFSAYANSNTSRYLTVNSNGYVVFGVPAGGGSAGDSTVFFTVYRADTMRIGIYGKIYSDSVLMRGLITSLTNYTDSLYNALSTKQGADSLLLAQQIETLNSDVSALDSALGVAFGAISNLYDTLPYYVPYTGATADLNLGTRNILPNSVMLSTTPTGTLTNVGQMYWDAANVTASMPLNANVTMQVGQEMYIRARNNTGVQINDGQVVYINDAQGNTPTIALANADSVTTSEVIGVATENIADNSTGFVTVFGIVNGYNTSAFNDGDILYLSTTSGQLTNVIPDPPNKVVKIAVAMNTTVNGRIFVHPSDPLGQDTLMVAPYNSNKIAPTQRAVGTFVMNTVNDTASDLRGLINTKGSGTVTSITGGYGLTGGTITSTGTFGVDSTLQATKLLVKKQIDSVAALSGGGGGSPISATAYQILYKSKTDTIKSTSKAYVDTTDNRLVLSYDSTTTSVAADPNGGIKIYGSNRMGMGAIRMADTVSIPAALQRAINAQTTSSIIPFNFSNPPTSLSYTGSYLWFKVVSTTYGTPVTNAFSSTIQHLNYPKAQFATGAGANATAAIRTGNADGACGLVCGNTKFSGGGGRGTFTFCFPTYASTQRIMIGYSERIDGLTGDPSTFLSTYSNIMIIKDAADGTLFFSHGSGAGATTKVNTGITPNAEDVYRLTVYVAPNSTFYAQLEVMSKTAAPIVVTINPTTNIPPVGDKLVQQQAVNNGTVGGVIVYGFIQHMEEIY